MRILWVLILCIPSFPQSLFFGSGASNPYTYLNNIQTITTQASGGTPPGWFICSAPCAGTSTGPTSITQTYSVSQDGRTTTKIAFNDGTGNPVDWLDTYKVLGGASRGSDATASTIATYTHLDCGWGFEPDTNSGTYVSNYESDCGFFSPLSTGANTTTGTNYMFGSQCNGSTGKYQVWDQGPSGGWVNATYSGGTINCTITAGQWNSVEIIGHIVTGDQTSCSSGTVTLGLPTDHYDTLIVNGVSYNLTNTNTCAGVLNPTFASLVFSQVQADTANGTNNLTAAIYYSPYFIGYY